MGALQFAAINVGDTVFSFNQSSYSSARTGSSLNLTTRTAGQLYVSPLESENYGYTCYEHFETYDVTSIDEATTHVISAFIQATNASVTTTSPSYDVEFRLKSWRPSVTTGDFVAGSSLGSLTQVARMSNPPSTGTFTRRGGSDTLVSQVATKAASGELELMASSSRHRIGNAPSGSERFSFSAGTLDLYAFTLPMSTLARVGGACCQLTDGTHAFLSSDGATPAAVTLNYAATPGASPTLIATLPSSFNKTIAAFQSFSLARNSADDLIVVGPDASNGNIIRVQRYTKGSGLTWSLGTASTYSVQAYSDASVICSAVSMDTSTGVDDAVLIAGRGAGYGTDTTHTLLTTTASYSSTLRDVNPGPGTASTYLNPTGTCLDMIPNAGVTYGVITATKARDNSVYLQSRGGTTGDMPLLNTVNASITVTNDANTKIRLLTIDSTKFAVVANGIVKVYNYNLTLLGTVNTITAGVSNTLSASQYNATAGWDCYYDAAAQKVWIVYIDASDSRIVRRLGASVTGFSTDAAAETINSSVGASGSTNLALRVPRGPITTGEVRIDVANRSSGGTLSTITVTSQSNVAPNAPTLTPRSNFDATNAAAFSWTFSDPNPGDTQSAYELEIYDTSDNSLDHDTGKVVSGTSSANVTGGTLTNGKSYQWRVRTWDAADAEGAWSSFGTFSTAAGGTVTITDPAMDNPADVITDSYTVEWSFSAAGGATQSERRVKVVATAAGTTLLDTGFQATTDNTYQVTGMLSDVEYRVEVTVVDTSAVTSNTGTRLITPSYGSPEAPEFAAVVGPNYIEININNPEPGGDRPQVSSNLIQRRTADGVADEISSESGEWRTIATVGINGTFIDYTVSSGLAYEYRIEGVA